MQLGGNNQQGLPTVPGRPVTPFAAVPSQTGPPTMPISSAIPLSSAAPQTSMAYSSGSSAAFQAPVPRGPPPFGYNGPSSSPPIYASKGSIGSSQFSPPSQTGPTLHGRVSQEQPPPMSQVSFLPPGSHFPSSRPVPGYQRPSVPLGIQSSSTIGSNMPPPPLSGKMQPPPIGGPPSVGGIVTPPPIGGTLTPPPSIAGNTAQGYLSMPPPSLASSYQAGRPVLQQPFAGANIQGPPLQPSLFHGHQGVTPGPPVPPVGFTSKDNIPYHLGGPPLGGTLQGLVEEFQSLSVGSAPGSLDAGIDVRSLPRPLDASDSNPISEQYPFNCHSRYFQLSTHAIPNSQSLLSRWHLPLGAVVHPLAEAPDGEDVPIVNFGPAGIIRCRRCRTYINPYVTFTDGGRKWRCNLCSLLNDVPGEYFCNLDATGRRLDVNQRPELAKGSVEYVAPTEYMVRPPMPPIYFFLIDVSVAAVQCGMLEVVAKTIKSCLDELPGFPRTQIGFITYDSTLHFYNMKSSLAQPQMMVVADLDDVFLPLPDDLLVNLSDSRNVVDAFLDSLPSMFLGNMNVESALGPALKAAFMVMSQLGGKLMVFQTTLPSLGIGRLKLRGDDLRIYGTDKEHTSRIPEDPSYKQLAAEFSKFHLGVNVYAFSDKYIDIASLGSLAKYTGGQVYYYPSFQAGVHNEKLKYDLSRDLTRETAWEAVMRVRCGKGARFTAYHGHFMLRSSDLLALPAVDCDKAFAMQLSLEETLLTSPTVYFQVALLYTSSSGERRIRVHTAAAPVVTDLSELYRQADIGAVVTLLNRVAIEKSLSHKLEEARQFVQMKIMKSLKEYRNLYVVQHRLGGRLIYPESLKLLPLYGLALCKSLALRGGYADALLDDRCAAGFNMMISSSNKTLKLLYPSLFKIDEYILKGTSESDNFGDALKALPLTGAVLDSKSLYVLDDGSRFVVWFGRMLSPDILTDIMGLESSSLPDLSKVPLVQRETTASKKLVKFLGKLKENDRLCYQLCHFVRQGEQPRENVLFLSNLVEDQTAGTSGYVEWVSQLYRQTQQNP